MESGGASGISGRSDNVGVRLERRRRGNQAPGLGLQLAGPPPLLSNRCQSARLGRRTRRKSERPGRRRSDNSGVAAGADIGGRWETPVESRAVPNPCTVYTSGRWRPPMEPDLNCLLSSESGVRFPPGAPANSLSAFFCPRVSLRDCRTADRGRIGPFGSVINRL